MGEKENKVLDEAASGVAESGNVAEQQVEQAETARQKAMKRVRERNKERNFADDDDEALYGAINEDAAADAEELDGYRQSSKQMNDFLQSDPKSADFLSRWRKSGSPVPGLVAEYGEEIVEDLMNPDNQSMIQEAQKEYLDRLAKSREIEDKYNQNKEATGQVVQECIDKYGEDKVRKAMESLAAKFEAFLVGSVEAKTIDDEIKALGYEEDMDMARTEGEIKGRNTNIAKEMNRRRSASDGLPNIGNGGGTVKEEKPDQTGALGALAGRKSVWD